jgi:hypothetical protein
MIHSSRPVLPMSLTLRSSGNLQLERESGGAVMIPRQMTNSSLEK